MFLQQDDLLEGRDYLHLLEGRYDLLDRRFDSFSWHKIWNASSPTAGNVWQ